MGSNKTISMRKGFRFEADKDLYSFRLKKRNWKWLWLLLLLLPLLLLIKCERNIDVTTVDKGSGNAIGNVDVTLNFTSHYLFNEGRFFYSKSETRSLTTDENGNGTFDKLGCSVFSYIFYCLSKAEFRISDDCRVTDPDPNASLFHYTWHKDITTSEKLLDLTMTVVDKETSDPLADAKVEYEYMLGGKKRSGTASTDPAGRFVASKVPACGEVIFKKTSCYGFEDLENVKKSVPYLLAHSDSARLELIPKKLSFSYFVKNKFTKEPIPGAKVEVVLTNPNGNTTGGRSTTNVDGKGRGEYQDAFVLAKLQLHASKQGFRPGHLDRDYTVEQFAKLPDDQRVVYLEPEPNTLQFRNIDSITGKPIVGVDNEIKRNSIDGKQYNTIEKSNRNGVFTVTALPDDALDITSTHEDYEPKSTHIAKVNKGEDIKMTPKKVSLDFRTVKEVAGGDLLPGCTLTISTDLRQGLSPSDSGSGEFEVKDLYVTEEISITAAKQDYVTNSVTIQNKKVKDLVNAPAQNRDIPLEPDMLPCDGGASVTPDVDYHERTYNMGKQRGHTTVDIDFDSAPDFLTIYDGPSTSGKVLLQKSSYTGTHSFSINFTQGSITVVVEGNTRRDYQVNCPN